MSSARIVETVAAAPPLECMIMDDRMCVLGGSAPFQIEANLDTVRESNSNIVQILEQVSSKSKLNLTLKETALQTTLKELREWGLAAYVHLGDQFGELWQNFGGVALDQNLVVTGDTFPLLWECVYTGPSSGAADAQRFWGLRHRITRRLPGLLQRLDGYYPPVGFLFNQHRNLKHVRDELAHLRQLCEEQFAFDVMDDRLDAHKPEMVVDDIFDRVLAVWTGDDYDFVHVASHLRQVGKEPHGQAATNSLIEISCVTIPTLIQLPLHRFVAAAYDRRFRRRPLVFLNACKTLGNELLLGSAGFPKALMKLGASAVIATVCTVPDLFAMEFAKVFYGLLFTHRSPGEALLEARRYFIEKHNNPLGLAYVLYTREDRPTPWINM